MNIVILDANFLLVPSQFRVDIYHEIRMILAGKLQIIVPPEVIEELNRKIENKSYLKLKRNISMALALLNQYKQQNPEHFLEISKNNTQNEQVDDYLINIAKHMLEDPNNRVFLATNDKILRKKASSASIRVIYLRQKKFIEIS